MTTRVTPGGWSVGGRVLLPDGSLIDGHVDISDGRIASIGAGPPTGAAMFDSRWTVVPGFVDIHMHGGGGFSVTAGDHEHVIGASTFHRRHGTTTNLVSLVTAPLDDLVAATASIAELLAEAPTRLRAQVAGVHLEGPFLAAARCGAQNPAHMVDPIARDVARLVEAGRGWLRVMTIAPERDGALDAIRQLVAAGVVPAIGHTDATYDQTTAAIRAGASLATHLGNAMPPLHHRAPGPFGGCLTTASVTCELIVDGHHLHPSTVHLAALAKGQDGIALITDAISATGAGDGRYVLGALDVDVRDGVARLTDGGSLAGSTLTMDVAFRNALACGLTLGQVSRAASLNPARVIGLDTELGSIERGKRANLVVLDEHLAVVAVVLDGRLDEP